MGVEIVTIVNQSGKIISNGKQLFSVFKEAKAAYDDKKNTIKASRAPPPPPPEEPYEVAPVPEYDPQFDPQYDPDVEYGGHSWQHQSLADDDTASRASSRRSGRSKASRATRLTAKNLKTLSEVSSVAPSRKPPTAVYRSPYAETAPRDMTLSRPTIVPDQRTHYDAPIHYDDPSLPRSHSAPTLHVKEPDMDLAYGNVPPDLADRTDLDPVYQAMKKEEQARTLMKRVETILTEANCMHHTATHMIKHLQEKPEAAAACALTLAELSTMLGKMSPAFLGILKGGSPAVFALLASPQFLIAAAGLTVGVTVVMFGGLKIVRRMKEKQALEAAAARQPIAYAPHPEERCEEPYMMQGPFVEQYQEPYYPEHHEESASQGGYDEALVLEEELSGIESWRRGIVPFGADESADMELISPEAQRALNGDDTQTVRSGRTARTHRTSKTAKTSKTHKSSHSHHHSHHHHSHHHSSGSSSHKPRSRSRESEARSVRSDVRDEGGDEAASEAGSHRSHKSHKSHRSHRSERTERSTKSHRSSKTTQSKRETKAIEDGSKDKENSIEAVLRPKKDTMLKSLFKKKKEQDDKQKEMATTRSSLRLA